MKTNNNQIGMFKELPKKSQMTDSDYESVTNKTFFLNNKL